MDSSAWDTYLDRMIDANRGDPRWDAGAFAESILDGAAPPHCVGPEEIAPRVPTLRQQREGEGHHVWVRLQGEEAASDLEATVFEDLDEDEVRCALYHLAYWDHHGHREGSEWARWLAA